MATGGALSVRATNKALMNATVSNAAESAATGDPFYQASGMGFSMIFASNKVSGEAIAEITNSPGTDAITGASVTVEALDESGLFSNSKVVSSSVTTNDGGATHWIDVGITGADADASWSSIFYSDDITAVASAPASSTFNSSWFYLEVITNNTGKTLVDQTCTLCPTGIGPASGGASDGKIAVIGSWKVLGGQGLTNGASARSGTNFELRSLPEPATPGLLGLGLLGLGLMRRRQG